MPSSTSLLPCVFSPVAFHEGQQQLRKSAPIHQKEGSGQSQNGRIQGAALGLFEKVFSVTVTIFGWDPMAWHGLLLPGLSILLKLGVDREDENETSCVRVKLFRDEKSV